MKIEPICLYFHNLAHIYPNQFTYIHGCPIRIEKMLIRKIHNFDGHLVWILQQMHDVHIALYMGCRCLYIYLRFTEIHRANITASNAK